jgi:beta-galactosidase
VVANNSAQPNSRWYSGTGIYRHVWLRQGGAVRIQPWGVRHHPQVDPASSTVSVATEIMNATGVDCGLTLRSMIVDASGKRVAQADTPLVSYANAQVTATQTFHVSPARLWSLEDPYRYTLQTQLLAASQVLDNEQTPFGIRSIAVDAEQGFRLNGVPLKLKGGCVHHDNGLLGAASYDRAEARKIELMLAAGYNAIRCAHNPPPPPCRGCGPAGYAGHRRP